MTFEGDVIYNRSTDAYFNLAAEEYLIDRADPRPVFMLWRNADAVIIGRNQNAYAEINSAYVEREGIKVVRRLTGGGAVFHDEGNVNYTFIVPEKEAKALDFARFAAPVVDALRALGADASLSGRNDIEIDGRKVSGNAQCVRSGKIMHHGTLLWSSDPSRIAAALAVDPEKIAAKGIKSVRGRVANISELVGSDMSVTEFIDYLFGFMGTVPRGFTEAETGAISRLRDGKYASWEWNYGESKTFSARAKRRFPYGTVEIGYTLDGGVIKEISILGDFFGVGDISELSRSLCGVRFGKSELIRALARVGDYISGAEPGEIAALMTGLD